MHCFLSLLPRLNLLFSPLEGYRVWPIGNAKKVGMKAVLIITRWMKTRELENGNGGAEVGIKLELGGVGIGREKGVLDEDGNGAKRSG